MWTEKTSRMGGASLTLFTQIPTQGLAGQFLFLPELDKTTVTCGDGLSLNFANTLDISSGTL